MVDAVTQTEQSEMLLDIEFSVVNNFKIIDTETWKTTLDELGFSSEICGNLTKYGGDLMEFECERKVVIGKNGLPLTNEQIAKREYMRNYMRKYTVNKKASDPTYFKRMYERSKERKAMKLSSTNVATNDITV